MRKYWKRILSILLIVVILSPSIAAAALEHDQSELDSAPVISDSMEGQTTQSNNESSWGSKGGGFIIGLGRCEFETYSGSPGDIDALYDWIAEYSTKYYEKVQGAAYYYHVDRSAPSKMKSVQLLGKSGDPLGIIDEVQSGGGEHIYKMPNGGYAIKKECVPEVVASLRECNEDLYRQYMDNPFGNDGHPVIIVVESVANMSDGYGYTVADTAIKVGTDIYGINLLGHEEMLCGSDGSGMSTVNSSTGKIIFDSVRGQDLNLTMGGRLVKAMFGINGQGKELTGKYGHHGYANYAGDGFHHEITGCYIISCGGIPMDGYTSSGSPSGSPSGGPSSDMAFLHGVYEWDFDSVQIPTNDRGHEEDGATEIAKGASVNGKFDFGFVNLKNSSAPAWKQVGQVYGGQSVDLELRVYGLGTGSGVKMYSVDSNQLMNAGDPNASGVIAGLQGVYTKNGVPWDEFVGYLENGTPEGFQFDGMSGGKVNAQISATATDGIVAVGYYTELFVTPHVPGCPQDGDHIRFPCNQVHYAIYTPRDSARTYSLIQTGLQGWSQLKDNSIGNAVFEAQAGTPTTEDMFISMGGSEYIVNMQYALHVEDYKRTYHLNVPAYDNYMYYNITGDSNSAETSQYENVSEDIEINKQPKHGGGAPNQKNAAYIQNSSEANADQKAIGQEQADAFHDAIEAMFESINENATKGSGVYSVDDYDIVVPADFPGLEGNWGIPDSWINSIKGNKDSVVSETQRQLRMLSADLIALKVWRDGDFNKSHYFSEFSARHTDLAEGYTISFFQLTDGLDYDSDADGAVTVDIRFTLRDTVDWAENPKQYTDKRTYDTAEKNGPSNGNQSGCQENNRTAYTYSVAENEDEWCGSSEGHHHHQLIGDYTHTVDNNDNCNSDGTDCDGHECTHSKSKLTDQPCKKHPHYGHEPYSTNDYQVLRGFHEEQWKASVDRESTHEANIHNPQEAWQADVSWEIVPNNMGDIVDRQTSGDPKQLEIANDEWDENRAKVLSYDATIYQVYKSVKFMDIVDCHVWRLSGGVADGNGLTDLMVEETDSAVITPIIEMACSNLGYTLFNTAPQEQTETFARTYTTADGKTYNQVWTAVDELFAEQIQIDEAIDEEPEWQANSELAAIGRLANSFNPNSSEQYQFFMDGKEGNEDVLTVEGEGDTLEFTYDIEEKGGRSHWSFDGFLKQAIANTFYDGKNRAGGAYRNYIIVQSDYLSIGNQPLTMSGMQWVSKSFDKGNGDQYDATSSEYGLSQAILNTNENIGASDLWRYTCDTGKGWKKGRSLEDTNINVSGKATHQDSSIDDIRDGSGGQSEVLEESEPSDRTAALGKYAEGPEELEQAYSDANPEFNNMFVRLDMDSEYGQWNVQQMVSSNISGEAGINANFDTEGKEGSGGSSLNFSGNIFPTVGYVGAEDSVIEDQHVYEPSGGGSTAFDPNATLVNGGFGGVDFDMYGNPNAASHLYIDTGASAAGASIVSAGSSPKNRVVNKGLMFPYYTGLNVIRWNPNNVYGGYETALVYDECLHFYEARPGVLSNEDQTKTKLQLSGGAIAPYKTSILTDLKQHGKFDDILAGNATGMGGSSGIITGVSYGGATKSSPGNTNSVTIFNPSTATNVKIIPMSERLPDGKNFSKDKDNRDDGYAERDQRVGENLVKSDAQETYISYDPLHIEDVTIKNLQYKFTLKDKTEYKGGITEYYKLDDYLNSKRTADTWTVTPTQDSFTVNKSGNYRLTLYDGNDKDTSVELKLDAGDKVSTDGTSVYLERQGDQAPLVTYDQLANSVAKYYTTIDNLTASGQSAMQSSLISNFVENNTKIVADIRAKRNRLNYVWGEDTVNYQTRRLTEAVDAVNSCIEEVNTALTQLDIRYEGQSYQWYEGGNVLYVPDVVDVTVLQGVLDEYRGMLSQLEQRAIQLNTTIHLADLIDFEIFEFDEHRYWTEDGIDVDSMQTDITRIRDDFNFFVSRYYEDEDRQQTYSDVRLTITQTNESAPSTAPKKKDYDLVVKSYREFLKMLAGTFNVTGGKLVLEYSNNYEMLEEFLFDLSVLRDEILHVSDLNHLNTTLEEVPTLSLEPKEGRAATFRHTDRFDVTTNGIMTMDFSGLGMSKGGTLVVRIPFDKNYQNPADVSLSADGVMLDFPSVRSGIRNMSGYDYTMYKYQDGNDWVYVIEALDDFRLGAMTFKFLNDCSIMNKSLSGQDFVYFEKIWLCDVGSAYSNPVYLGTTIEHNHYEAGSIYWNKATRTRSINKVLFDEVGMEATVTVTKKTATLYISREQDTNMILSPDALDNPHKVYNANWRYYVIGWETENGSKVTGPDDPRLFIDSTVLKWPSAASGTVTVGELRTSACLVKVNGTVYLTLKEAGLQHKILETGIKVSSYDLWTLGKPGLPKRIITTTTVGSFPLQPNVPAKGVGGGTDGQLAFQDFSYEFFFSLLDEDAPLFNVEWSQNIEYRFSSTDKNKTVTEEENWRLDWTRSEHNQSANTTLIPGRSESSATSNYISLDDEFDVYFDNVGEFTGNANSYNAHVDGPNSGKLGYGWNANGIKLLGSDVEKGIADWYGGGSDGVGSSQYMDGENLATRQTTECTGWIYAKYLVFNIDVYVFKDETGKINPTVGAYDAAGNLREPILVEAGNPVYLGEYLGSHSNAADNFGGFLDYGAPSVTKDKYGDAFTYHFWCPLYNGESNNGVKVEFHTVNINDNHASGNPGGDLNAYLLNGSNDGGIGTNHYLKQTPTNRNDSIVNDMRHANNEVKTSIVGRIGALTISDTGDPRYSDSFKITDLVDDSVENFLIYPIVRKIRQYTNIYSGTYTAGEGSQRGVVIDPFDVRGRICTAWMVDYAKQHHAEWESIDYKVYASESYDTYGSQWYKHTITRYEREHSEESSTIQYAMAVPLTPEFNKHDTFKNKPLRVGYEVYLSLESIGNYFGDSTRFDDPEDENIVSNGNNDYGQDKVQIRPFYAAIDAEDGDGNSYEGPVDVYMRAGDTYVLINSGCDKNTSADTDTVCQNSEHSISQVLAVLYNNYDPNYIETNTGDTPLELDENMMRRMVTGEESQRTNDVLAATGGKSILTKTDKSTGGIGGQELEIRYTYGCSQMLFLRERNMTYVGGKTAALDYTNPIPYVKTLVNKQYGQKWYFGLGLPSSAVFVPHGKELNLHNVLKKGFVVNSIDVVISGHVWTLHYESEVSKMSFEYEDGIWNYELWNPWYEKYPWLIPVTYYNIGDTSTADLDTQGSH